MEPEPEIPNDESVKPKNFSHHEVIPEAMMQDLLDSLELESDDMRRSTIMKHLQNYKDTEITIESIFPIAMDYFYKLPHEKFELLEMKAGNHVVDMTDDDEVDHAQLSL